MSTPNSGKSFEEQLREKLEGHEYEYHPSYWARMQHKLNAHMHAAGAAKSAALKKGLYSAGKITGGLIGAGAVIYTVLSLAGIVDRADLGLGEKTQIPVSVSTDARSHSQTQVQLANEAPAEKEPGHIAENPGRKNESPAGTSIYYSTDPWTRLPDDMDYFESKLLQEHMLKQFEHLQNGILADEKTSNSNQGSEGIKNPEENALANNTISTVADEKPEPEKNEIEKNDSAAENPVNPLAPEGNMDPDKDQVKPFRPQLGFVGGASLASDASGSADNSKSVSFNPNMIGAYIAIPLNSRFTIESGVQFRNQHNWNFRQTTSQVYYSMMQDSTFTEYTITSGQYIDIPLLFKYNLTSRFQLHAGAKLNLLRSSRGTLSRVSYQNGKYSSHETREVYTDPLVLRRTDINAVAGLEYRVTKLLSLGASYRYGLQDIRLPQASIVAQPLRNTYLQLYGAIRLF